MSKKKTPRERPLYSQRFLEKYGRTLRREEVRLVQGYRGLSLKQREGLLMFVSAIVIDNAQTGLQAGAK
jgi:hypothetical protein